MNSCNKDTSPFFSLRSFLHLTFLVYTLPSAHDLHWIFLQGSAQGWENKPNQVSLSLHSLIGSWCAMQRTDGGVAAWLCLHRLLTLSIWRFFFSIIGEECWWHDMSSVNCRGLKEASRWRVWCWRGGDMTPYGFCVSFLPVLVYGSLWDHPPIISNIWLTGESRRSFLFQYSMKGYFTADRREHCDTLLYKQIQWFLWVYQFGKILSVCLLLWPTFTHYKSLQVQLVIQMHGSPHADTLPVEQLSFCSQCQIIVTVCYLTCPTVTGRLPELVWSFLGNKQYVMTLHPHREVLDNSLLYNIGQSKYSLAKTH